MLLLLACSSTSDPPPSSDHTPAAAGAKLNAVGPRLVTNQTELPLFVYGEGLTGDMTLHLGTQTLPITPIDASLALAMLPAGWGADGNFSTRDVEATLMQGDTTLPGKDVLTIVDDVGFPTFSDMVVWQGVPHVSMPNQDTIWTPTGTTPTADGPTAMARWKDSLVVVHRFDPTLLILDPKGTRREVNVPRGSQGIAVDGDTAWISNLVEDALIAVDLPTGRVVSTNKVGINPRGITKLGDSWVTANLGSSDLSLVQGPQEQRFQATRATTILGGPTERFQHTVMNGKAVRDLVSSPSLGLAFGATVGPNTGPNPDRWEVAMNGGISVISPKGKVLRHVAIGGIPQDLALDESRGILYASSLSTGEIVALDTHKLSQSDTTARSAELGRITLTPPDGPRLRGDWSPEWNSEALHTGPGLLALHDNTLFVLSRFTGVIDRIDTKSMTLGTPLATISLGNQALRRLGEVTYHTDVGRTQMSCDGCHMDGHNEGLLFTKGSPIRIYRVTSMRGQRDAAPYFTPARFPTMATAMKIVLGRNRYHRPDPNRGEFTAVAHYTDTIAPLPSPWLAQGWPGEVLLPDGETGSPTAGWSTFRALDCVACHPPPQFTLDQADQTSGQLFDVGTEMAIPLRPEMQDMDRIGMATPPLVGVWDNYPLLLSGSAGFSLIDEHTIAATEPFPLKAVLTHRGRNQHGRMGELTQEQTTDILAFLMML